MALVANEWRLGPLWRRAAIASRPVAFAAIALAIVAVTVRGVDLDPFGGLFRYVLEVFVIVAVGLGALATWWAVRRGQTWDADLIPVLAGAVGAFTLFGMLHGTPWGPGGIVGDAVFRTEAVVRFADTWGTADFTYRGLPAFYAPASFWILGRGADIFGLEPWRMIKFGTILSAMLVPLVSYYLWRRIVATRVAALIAILPLVLDTLWFYEPYAWVVAFAIVPWWILTVHGLHRADIRPPHPVALGIVGGVLFMTYYYFFVVAAVALLIHLIALAVRGELLWQSLRTPAWSFLVSGVVSAVFWLPLGLSLLGAGQIDTQLGRWFNDSHGVPQLPFVEFTPQGVLSLVGLGYLVLTAREPLSRALLTLLSGVAAWYLIGLPAALIDSPILSFRSKPLIPIILYTAGVLALVRIAQIAPGRFSRDQRGQVRLAFALGGVLLAFMAGRSFMVAVVRNDLTAAAHAAPWPSGILPRFAPGGAQRPAVPANAIRDLISNRFAGPDHPVVLSTRPDVLALNPYYGFSQWHVFYAHPAAEFHGRIDFLRQLAAAASPTQFAALSIANPYDRIDAFVLDDADQLLEFRFRDDNFPMGSKPGVVAFPRSLFDPAVFSIVDLGDYVVAVRR